MKGVSRYVNAEELKFTIEFVTPAFLDGADGNTEVCSFFL